MTEQTCGSTTSIPRSDDGSIPDTVLVCVRLPHPERWHAAADGSEWGGAHNGPVGCSDAGRDGHRFCTAPTLGISKGLLS